MSSLTGMCRSLTRRLLLSVRVDRERSRGLLTPTSEIPYKTSTEVIRALTQNVIGETVCIQFLKFLKLHITGGPSTYDPDLYNKQREKLLKILPTEQSQLPPRRMIDSFDSAIIPIASDPSLRVSLTPDSVCCSARGNKQRRKSDDRHKADIE